MSMNEVPGLLVTMDGNDTSHWTHLICYIIVINHSCGKSVHLRYSLGEGSHLTP